MNPVLTVGDQLTETLMQHRRPGIAKARAMAVEMFDRVRLSDPERRMRQYPHELSGGIASA